MLAMNGGHVHEPKLRTSGRPALCEEEKYLHHLPGNSDVHLARESSGTLLLVSKLISSGLGAAPPTWVNVVKVWIPFLSTLLFETRGAQNFGVSFNIQNMCNCQHDNKAGPREKYG